MQNGYILVRGYGKQSMDEKLLNDLLVISFTIVMVCRIDELLIAIKLPKLNDLVGTI